MTTLPIRRPAAFLLLDLLGRELAAGEALALAIARCDPGHWRFAEALASHRDRAGALGRRLDALFRGAAAPAPAARGPFDALLEELACAPQAEHAERLVAEAEALSRDHYRQVAAHSDPPTRSFLAAEVLPGQERTARLFARPPIPPAP
jgi:hypothetical protein